MPDSVIEGLTASVLSPERAAAASVVRVSEALLDGDARVSRAQLAMALNIILFTELLERVPSAATYVRGTTAGRQTVVFDHGALRTIDGATGALPGGHTAFARLLEPLGYVVGGTYPLPRLHMTGRAFVHRDLPDDVPQLFVSELHVGELADEAQDAVGRVFDRSVDPLGPAEWALLAQMDEAGECDRDVALAGLPGLVRAFGRHHPEPPLADYQALLRHSSEAAWIATEGNTFNHATDRVADVAALATSLQAQGFAMKASVEISANGRVRQTALLADPVVRRFAAPDGTLVEQSVPGSFYEFISRDVDPATGRLDLSFDSGNATGIFSVTRAS